MGNPQQQLLPPPHAGSKLSRAERSSCPSRHGARSSANEPAHCRAQPPLVCHDHWHWGKRRCRFSSSISSATQLSFVGHAARGVLPLRHRLGTLARKRRYSAPAAPPKTTLFEKNISPSDHLLTSQQQHGLCLAPKTYWQLPNHLWLIMVSGTQQIPG